MNFLKNKYFGKAWLATVAAKDQETQLAAAEQLAAVLRETKELTDALSLPTLSDARKRQLLTAAFPAASDELCGLIVLLAKQNRLNDFAVVIREARQQYNEETQTGEAQVLSAIKLSVGQLREIERILHQKTGKKYSVKNHLTATLLGGLIVKIDDRQWDFSVANRLNNLREHIKQ